MAQKSIKLNSLENTFEIINDDIKNIKLENSSIDAIVTNPPYKKMGTGIKSKESKQLVSRYETTATLDDWLKISSKLLKDNGSFYIVYRTDRLTELIENMRKYKLEAKRIRFVFSNIEKQSNLVLIKANKGAGTFVKIEKPLIIYNLDGSYTDEIIKIYKTK